MREFWNKTWSRPYGRYNRHHKEVWDEFLKLGIEGNIVDLGCGPCVIYQGKKVKLTGVDWSEEALKEARKNCPCGTFILADVRNTGLPSGQFDAVIMLGLLDYFDNWEEVIKEAKRLLKKGGKIFATLLDGYEGHDWSKYPKITSNWHLVTFAK